MERRRGRVVRALEALGSELSRMRGEAFFAHLVEHLAQATRADIAFVGELVGEGFGRVRTISLMSHGEWLPNIEYDLAHTPCANVVEQGICSYADGVQELFPKDGLLVEMNARGYAGSPLHDREGRPLGIVAVLYDHPVSEPQVAHALLDLFAARAAGEVERRRAQRKQRTLESRLRQASRLASVGRLASGVAHDFNNLLMPILSTADSLLCSEDIPVQELLEDLGVIRAAARQAQQLTQQLLAISREQPQHLEDIELWTVAEGLLPLLRRTLPKEVNITLEGHGRGAMRGDRGQLEQVLLNLAVNARDAMPGGGTLRLIINDVEVVESCWEELPDAALGPAVRLDVCDDGEGIPDELLPLIFEPFVSSKGAGKGTGLGLSIVDGIVGQHGGAAWVDSQPERGTRFTFLLPRRVVAVEAA